MTILKHLLTGEELAVNNINALLDLSIFLKKTEGCHFYANALQGRHLALLFDKPSLRTRFSFIVAMNQLGGDAIESAQVSRKMESPEDQARVLSGYCDAIMIRTHSDEILRQMATVSRIPILNGLSDKHHPCQILADLLTLKEIFGDLKGLTLTYIGDGNNVLQSLLLIAPQMGVNIHYCCPTMRQPNQSILEKSKSRLNEATGKITSFTHPKEAVMNVDVVYTDTWNSMGFENQSADHLFEHFQVNERLMQYAKNNAKFMHCLPLERGKEVNATLPESGCSVIFQQSENRLHMQKALLLHCLGGV